MDFGAQFPEPEQRRSWQPGEQFDITSPSIVHSDTLADLMVFNQFTERCNMTWILDNFISSPSGPISNKKKKN
jgi:hypothetical protein